MATSRNAISDWRNSGERRTKLQDVTGILLEKGLFSDITFIVGSEKVRIPSHTFILMARSSVFEVMFNDTWNTRNPEDQTVVISDTEPDAFRQFLKFLYTDEHDVSKPIEVFYLAHKYDVVELQQLLQILLKRNMAPGNALSIYTTAKMFDLKALEDSTMAYMLKNARALVQQQEFLNLNEDMVCDLISRNELNIDEVELFHAVKNWALAECLRRNLRPTKPSIREVLEKVLPLIRFPLMKANEFSANVVNTDILTKQQIIQLFMYFNLSMPERNSIIPHLNYSFEQRMVSHQRQNNWPFAAEKYSVGVYLSSEFCFPNSLSYRIGSGGKVHDESLDFSSTHNIELLGIGLYGPGSRHEDGFVFRTYEVDVKLYSLAHGLEQLPRSNIGHAIRNVSTKDDFEVHFIHPIQIQKNKPYHIRLGFRGEETRHGISRLSHVSTQCKGEQVTFSFMGPPNVAGMTPDGRIRTLVFRVVE